MGCVPPRGVSIHGFLTVGTRRADEADESIPVTIAVARCSRGRVMKHPCFPLGRALLGPAFLWLLGTLVVTASPPAGSPNPILKVPAICVFGRAYPPDSPKLPAVLAQSKGDREESEITLVVSEYSYNRDSIYYTSRMHVRSFTRYNPRTGAYTSTTSHVSIDPAGKVTTRTDNDPSGIVPEQRTYTCLDLSQKVFEKIDTSSKCVLMHKVTRTSKSGSINAWNPVCVGVIFFTHPTSADCKPTTREARSLKYEVSMRPWEIREFDVVEAGFKNEICDDVMDSFVYFPMSVIETSNPPANAK